VTVEVGNAVGTDATPPQVPPQTLRRQAQRLSRFSGRAVRSGRPDADEEDGWLCICWCLGRFQAECGDFVGSIAYF
jgi:hypothetical protein